MHRLRGDGLAQSAVNLRDHRLGSGALVILGARSLEPTLVQDTLGLLLKYDEDRAKVDRTTRESSRPRSSRADPRA